MNRALPIGFPVKGELVPCGKFKAAAKEVLHSGKSVSGVIGHGIDLDAVAGVENHGLLDAVQGQEVPERIRHLFLGECQPFPDFHGSDLVADAETNEVHSGTEFDQRESRRFNGALNAPTSSG
jgi:hypothetical protein